ncbi:MAG TPA: transcriptional repressor [Clostridia bacterium]
MASKRQTMQKQIIYEAVTSLNNHPTAEEIYNYIHPKYSQISLSTVYRNLYALVQEGKIKKLSAFTPERFDNFVQDHIHFRCCKCDTVLDLNIDLSRSITNELKKNGFDLNIKDISIVLDGVCEECKKNLKKD